MNLQTNVLTTNRFTFTDTNTGNAPWRFYRVIESFIDDDRGARRKPKLGQSLQPEKKKGRIFIRPT